VVLLTEWSVVVEVPADTSDTGGRDSAMVLDASQWAADASTRVSTEAGTAV